jgi:DNA (cytosine-5)-methyltransferase 1
VTSPLVLSLFPGIGLLDMAFELEGFCVVRGPDLWWGGDVHRFSIPPPKSGVFDGVIGGPPCKGESALAHLNGTVGVTLRHEFSRVVHEADPDWWVMEAVKPHPDFMHRSACVASQELDRSRGNAPDCICERRHGPVYVCPLTPRWLGEQQSRLRYFHSNLPLRSHVEVQAFVPVDFKYAVLAGHGGAEGTIQRGMATYSWPEMCRLQGLPESFDLPGFTRQAKREAVGNGVPLVMGRAIARAVKQAIAERAA